METRDFWSETISAVLISVAAIAQAWAGYQATLWNSAMATLYQKASSARTEAVHHANLAAQYFALDANTFMQLVTAHASGNRKLAEFILERVRPEAKPAVTAWLATRPSVNPSAPPTPFRMPEYRLAEQEISDRLFEESNRSDSQGDGANHLNDQYARLTVFLAMVSFLGGISTRFHGRSARAAVVGVATLLMAASVALFFFLPIARAGA